MRLSLTEEDKAAMELPAKEFLEWVVIHNGNLHSAVRQRVYDMFNNGGGADMMCRGSLSPSMIGQAKNVLLGEHFEQHLVNKVVEKLK
jgi:hypothetical protein